MTKSLENIVGKVSGLAWTEVGGELLTIETSYVPGKGRVIKTGSLGDVMQESIQAALTVVRSRSEKLGIPADFYEKYDVHIHVPDGATPKDGPSAGAAFTLAIYSVLTNQKVNNKICMTGEIDLIGNITAIGGVESKLHGGKKAGCTMALIPQENWEDFEILIREGNSPEDNTFSVKPISHIKELIKYAIMV